MIPADFDKFHQFDTDLIEKHIKSLSTKERFRYLTECMDCFQDNFLRGVISHMKTGKWIHISTLMPWVDYFNGLDEGSALEEAVSNTAEYFTNHGKGERKVLSCGIAWNDDPENGDLYNLCAVCADVTVTHLDELLARCERMLKAEEICSLVDVVAVEQIGAEPVKKPARSR